MSLIFETLPIIKEKELIISVYNKAQADSFEKKKMTIKEELEKTFSTNIRITTKIDEKNKVFKNILSPKEKIDQFADANPNIKNLIDKLGLEYKYE